MPPRSGHSAIVGTLELSAPRWSTEGRLHQMNRRTPIKGAWRIQWGRDLLFEAGLAHMRDRYQFFRWASNPGPGSESLLA